MVTIPKHFEEAFPWIVKAPSKIKVSAPTTEWMEKEIVRLIFNPPVNQMEDFRPRLIKSLGKFGQEAQVSYTKVIAKCLAEAVIDTPQSKTTYLWLKDVNVAAKRLCSLLSGESKPPLPANWDNLFLIVKQIIKSEAEEFGYPDSDDLVNSLRKENLRWRDRKGALEKRGRTDLVAILNLVLAQSNELAGKNAIAFYRYPQKFFEEISTDNTLFLDYQRRAIRSIAAVNQVHYGKPYDAMTAHVLACVFKKKLSNQMVKDNREKKQDKILGEAQLLLS